MTTTQVHFHIKELSIPFLRQRERKIIGVDLLLITLPMIVLLNPGLSSLPWGFRDLYSCVIGPDYPTPSSDSSCERASLPIVERETCPERRW